MLYLGNASSPAVRDAIRAGEIGMMCTPAEGRSPVLAAAWAADNGCFGTGYPGDFAWRYWLRRHRAHVRRCLWATAPDVVGDAAATLRRSRPHFDAIRALGYRAALVAQDGLNAIGTPWDEFDTLFLGGTTSWKLGPRAAELVHEALRRGKTVHMGRVNSQKRWDYARSLGCSSADGTCLAFAPDANLRRVLSWKTASWRRDTTHESRAA